MFKSCNLQTFSYFSFTPFLITDLSFPAMSGYREGFFHFDMLKSNTNTTSFPYLVKYLLPTFYFTDYKMHCS